MLDFTLYHSRITDLPADRWTERRDVKAFCRFASLRLKTLHFNLISTEITSAGVGFSAAGAGKAGPYLKEKGVMTFYEICEKIVKNGIDVDFDEKQQCPHVVVDNTFIGFDNEKR